LRPHQLHPPLHFRRRRSRVQRAPQMRVQLLRRRPQHRDRDDGAQLAPLQVEPRTPDHLAVRVDQHQVLERRMQGPQVHEQLVIGPPVHVAAHHGAPLGPRLPVGVRQLLGVVPASVVGERPALLAPPSFHCANPPFTRSPPTVSPRVFTLGRATSDAGRGLNPSSSSTAAIASAAASPCPSATLSATPSPSRGSTAQYTPSAPTLTITRPGCARIISVQGRPEPAMRSGWRSMASTMRNAERGTRNRLADVVARTSSH